MDDALCRVVRPVALDRERGSQGSDGRIADPLREVELLDLCLALPGEFGSEIPDFGRDAADTRRGDAGVDEQAIQVADRMRDAGDATLVRKRPGRIDVERDRVARVQAAARAGDRPARRADAHAVELDPALRKLRGTPDVPEGHFRAIRRHDQEARHPGLVDHDREPARHERRRARWAGRRPKANCRLRNAHALGGYPPGEDLERLVVGFEARDADRGPRMIDLDGCDRKRPDQAPARAFDPDLHRIQ